MQIKSIISSSIFKNLSVLVSGTVLAQFVVLGFQLVLRRVFTPEDFGAFAVYMSVVGMAITIVSLRYEQTIVLPKADSEAVQLTKLSIFIAGIFVSLFAFFLLLFGKQFMLWIGLNTNYITWLYFLPGTILVFAIYQSLNFLQIRLKDFKVSGSNKVVRRITEGGIQSGMSIVGANLGLILGDIIAHIIIITRSIFHLNKFHGISFTKSYQGDSFELLKSYKEFPQKSAIPSLINAVSRLLPIILISKYFNAEITGFFDLSRVVLILPLSLITVSLNQVLLQQFSEKRNNKQSVRKEALGVFGGLSIAAVLFVVFIALFGLDLFTMLFGDMWKTSGYYAQILVFAFAIKFIVSPFNACFTAFEKIGWYSIWQIIYFVLILLLLIVPHNNIVSFLKVYMLIEVFAFGIAAILNFSILRKYEKSLKRND